MTDANPLRRAVLVVALVNFIYFGVELAVARRIGSVSLFADSVDFLEDTSVNLLIALALGWSAKARARLGMLLADGGDPPSYKHVVESPEFQAKWKKDAENWPFMEALPGFVPYYNFPTFWDARTAINNQLMDIWAGKASVRDALAEAQRQAQALLDKGLAQGA